MFGFRQTRNWTSSLCALRLHRLGSLYWSGYNINCLCYPINRSVNISSGGRTLWAPDTLVSCSSQRTRVERKQRHQLNRYKLRPKRTERTESDPTTDWVRSRTVGFIFYGLGARQIARLHAFIEYSLLQSIYYTTFPLSFVKEVCFWLKTTFSRLSSIIEIQGWVEEIHSHSFLSWSDSTNGMVFERLSLLCG